MKEKPFHIVHVLGTLGMGGAQRMVLDLVSSPELSEYRHSIVCIISKQGEFLEFCEAHNIPVYACPLRWPVSTLLPSYRMNRWLRDHLYFMFPRRMASLLRAMDADLVHTHVTKKVSLQAKAAIRYAKLPWIWSLQGLCRTEGMDISDLPQTVELINRSKAIVTAVSQAALNEVVSDSVIAPGKTRVIYNGVNLNRFSPSIPRDPVWRAQWGIPAKEMVFGTAGRLVKAKRQDLFIEAASELIKRGSSAHFVIAGDGPLHMDLKKRIQTLGLGGRIHLVGYQSDMQRFLREIDVLVLPSDSEGLPLVLLEAAAMELPIIATAVGGVPDVLKNGCGLLIEPGSLLALVEAMQQMLFDGLRKKFASYGRRTAEHFSSDGIALQYARLYNELLEQTT